ncbi:MAG: penicillin-binding protein activator [Burkholderiales bacterium]|nr:penicillin-binding protein activator [Burkholderiales bacterium]
MFYLKADQAERNGNVMWRARSFLLAIVTSMTILATFGVLARDNNVTTPTATPAVPLMNIPSAPPVSAAPQATPNTPEIPTIRLSPAPPQSPLAQQSEIAEPRWERREYLPIAPAEGRDSAPLIALILPQKTEAYRSAAQTLRAGFAAAAKAAQAEDLYIVIEHEAGQAAYAFAEAQRIGARVAVGPLLRDDLRILLRSPPTLWTVALTQLEDLDAPLPKNIFPLTLTVESDARLLARELLTSGRMQGLVLLTSETPLMKRFSDALIDEWLRLGEAPPKRMVFTIEEMTETKEKLDMISPSTIVLAVEGNDAILGRALTKPWTTYASGHIYQRAAQFEEFAFDQLRVVEIPWLVDQHAERFKHLGMPPETPVMARLYALGFDAFQIATAFSDGPPLSLNINGASGYIRFDAKEGLLRNGQMAIFDRGRLRPLTAVIP